MSPERIAPEQFGFKNSRPTISSDCYALGMVIYETISGNVPFHKDTDLTVSVKVVVKGEHPPRGTKFTKSLWGMLERCWASKPHRRPSIRDVFRHLEVSDASEPSSPWAGEVMYDDEDGDDWDSEPGSSAGDVLDFFAPDDRVQPSPDDSDDESWSDAALSSTSGAIQSSASPFTPSTSYSASRATVLPTSRPSRSSGLPSTFSSTPNTNRKSRTLRSEVPLLLKAPNSRNGLHEGDKSGTGRGPNRDTNRSRQEKNEKRRSGSHVLAPWRGRVER